MIKLLGDFYYLPMQVLDDLLQGGLTLPAFVYYTSGMTNKENLPKTQAAALASITEMLASGDVSRSAAQLAGVNVAALSGLVKRGILQVSRKPMVMTTGPLAGQEIQEIFYAAN